MVTWHRAIVQSNFEQNASIKIQIMQPKAEKLSDHAKRKCLSGKKKCDLRSKYTTHNYALHVPKKLIPLQKAVGENVKYHRHF